MKTVFLDFDSLRPADLDTTELSAQLDELTLWPDSAKAVIKERIAAAEVVVVNKIKLTRPLMASAPELKLICLAATGSDNIDLSAASELGIGVSNIRNYCTPSVVQHVFAMILTLTQELPAYRKQVRDGVWQASSNFCLLDPPIRELQGKTLGLVGLGALGSGVAAVAQAFGMQVGAATFPWRSPSPDSKFAADIARLPLDELLAQSDIVSLHCPLNEDTRHLIDAQALRRMRSDALLINTARGALVDSEALVAALRNGEIAGAGIDVLAQEPPRDGDPLLDARLRNLIVTPHMAWSARESRQRALDQILANILAFKSGGDLNRLC